MKYAFLAVAFLAGCAGSGAVKDGGMTAPQIDTCGASAQQELIGQDAAAALIVPEPKRIYRTDETVTQDFVPERINVVLDETDVIISVRCG